MQENLSLMFLPMLFQANWSCPALPGNFRSLNIVSQQIRDDEHAASPPGMLNVQLAGKHWHQGFIRMIHWIK